MLEQINNEKNVHPLGEHQKGTVEKKRDNFCETFGGKIHVNWDENAPMTPHAQAVYFADFLKVTGLYESWLKETPLHLKSPNTPKKEDVIGTAFLGILTGQNRYAHITGIRRDEVLMKCFGLTKIVSEDSLRRNLKKIDEESGYSWLLKHLKICYWPLLYEPYIIDIDVTVKPIYGKQEGANLGYNPHKPGRPSHTYHTYFISNLRLVLHVDIKPGNESSSKYTQEGFWVYIDGLPMNCRPKIIRGDIAFGTDSMMESSKNCNLKYLFKLKRTKRVKELIEILAHRDDLEWENANNGWEGVNSTIRLTGWKKQRRIIILRRVLKEQNNFKKDKKDQGHFYFYNDISTKKKYEYTVLVTNLELEILSISQLYHERADAENNFDEMKNQWGWGGYTTQDLKRCRLMARMIALVYNWWNIFIRLAVPKKHHEAITSRPLFLNGVGRMIKHARQTKLILSSLHGRSIGISEIMQKINSLLIWIRRNAEQLAIFGIYRMVLSIAFKYFIGERPLKVPIGLEFQ